VVNKDWEEISQDNLFYIEISAIMFPETERLTHFKNRKESLALDVPKIDTLLSLIRPTSEIKAQHQQL
jgi:hypothetical protein